MALVSSASEPLPVGSFEIATLPEAWARAAVTPEAYEISMELPGVGQDDIDIAVQDNMLIVTGEKRSEHEETGKSYFFSEREYGAFQRAFRIPPDADQEAIDAEFRNGILTLKLPKMRAASGPARKVSIRGA